MSPPEEGDLFGDESDLDALAALPGPLPSPGPPATWTFNEYGQPEWLLSAPWAQVGSSWGVIVPPSDQVQPPRAVRLARGLDRQHQGLDTWGAGRAPLLRRVLETGPASMPAITWATPRPRRRGHPGLAWNESEVATCAAWLSDIRGLTNPAIATQLFEPEARQDTSTVGQPTQDEGTVRAKVRRYLGAGRQALCDQGVWPWLSVPLDRIDDDPADIEGNRLPDHWWEDDDVLAHLQVWNEVGAHQYAARQHFINAAAASGSTDIPDPW